MSVHKLTTTLSLLGIVTACLLFVACGPTTSNSSSISITATPVAQNIPPGGQETGGSGILAGPGNQPVPANQLGNESTGSSDSAQQQVAIAANDDLPSRKDIPAGQPAPTTPTVAPTVPPPTAAPTQAPAKPVVTFQNYVVQLGDSLQQIADRNGVSATELMTLNGIRNPNLIYVGQVLKLKQVIQTVRAPDGKLVPDSEAVYSPAYENFDVNAVAQSFGGYLTRYSEVVEGMNLTGPQIVQLVSERFSVGPRVLLTILELESGWMTRNPANLTETYYPMGLVSAGWSGLYRQLWWAADKLNEGYYGRYYKNIDGLSFGRTYISFSAGTNPGTAAIQHYLSLVSPYNTWTFEVGPTGFPATYQKLFGDPFAHAIEPLVPDNLVQPTLHLPWQEDHTWWFTGGPHGGWADGSAWAAVDFAPSQGSGSCDPSPEWATAAAPGQIVNVEIGRVMENLDGKNFQGDGWVLMYMHMASSGRVRIGDKVNTGDPIGHPSCEGGYSTADHLHFARLYNGQWLAAADRQRPMVISGWKLAGASAEYDGSMTRGSDYLEAYNGHSPRLNMITSDDGPVPTTAENSAQGGNVAAAPPVAAPDRSGSQNSRPGGGAPSMSASDAGNSATAP